MAEFLEVIDNIRSEEASVQRIFQGDGTGIRHFQKSPQYPRKLAEAARFIAEVYNGARPVYHLREALTTSDFPLLFGDVLDRQLLANFREAPADYRQYMRISTVPDFRSVSRYAVDGAEGQMSQVPEQTEYPAVTISEARDQYSVRKYGNRIPFSWEAMINDDLDALKDIPARFGKSARRSEYKFATELFVDTSGPHASLYSAGNANIINTTNGGAADNPPLSIAGLQDGMTVLGNMVDADGEPIIMEMVHLVVPPSLAITARNIVNSIELNLTTLGGAVSGQGLTTTNWMRGMVQLHVNPYIPIVASSANGATSWFLFGNPSMNRPAIEMGFLRGHLEPEIWFKAPNALRVGGGAVNPMEGDFDTDSIQYRVRHVFGGTRYTTTGGYRSTVASNGSASP